MFPTLDPNVVIEDRGSEWVIYRDVNGARWIIKGTCTACGACEQFENQDWQIWTGLPVGHPGACLDKRYGDRPDIPVSPSISKYSSCTLTGEYLEPWQPDYI